MRLVAIRRLPRMLARLLAGLVATVQIAVAADICSQDLASSGGVRVIEAERGGHHGFFDAALCSSDFARGGGITPSVAGSPDPGVREPHSGLLLPPYERPALNWEPTALAPDPIGPRRHLLFGSFLL